jgi:NAD+ kinase
VPKVPIRNSRRGKRCIAHPPAAVIERLARNELVRTEYMKIEVHVGHVNGEAEPFRLTAMNEFNVHMGRINSAVRFAVWIDDEPYNDGQEILGDGFVISTPFGSTAYYNQITRGVFHKGLGLAFKHTTEHTNHVVAPEDATIRVLITRGPAVLGCDNATEYYELNAGHELVARKHAHPSVLLTWERMSHPSDQF